MSPVRELSSNLLRQPVSRDHIEELTRATDRERANYVQTYYGCHWKDPHHMMLSSTLGKEQAGWMIIDAVEQWGRYGDVR
jgi:hypothetical protein